MNLRVNGTLNVRVNRGVNARVNLRVNGGVNRGVTGRVNCAFLQQRQRLIRLPPLKLRVLLMQPPKLPHNHTLNRPRPHSGKLTRHSRRQVPLLHQPVMPHKSTHQKLIRILINHDETTINEFTGCRHHHRAGPRRAQPRKPARVPRPHPGTVHSWVRDEHKVEQLRITT